MVAEVCEQYIILARYYYQRETKEIHEKELIYLIFVQSDFFLVNNSILFVLGTVNHLIQINLSIFLLKDN
jgi:hypothetical protein